MTHERYTSVIQDCKTVPYYFSDLIQGRFLLCLPGPREIEIQLHKLMKLRLLTFSAGVETTLQHELTRKSRYSSCPQASLFSRLYPRFCRPTSPLGFGILVAFGTGTATDESESSPDVSPLLDSAMVAMSSSDCSAGDVGRDLPMAMRCGVTERTICGSSLSIR